MSDTPSTHPADGRVAYRWIAMGVALFGTFMVVLDTTVINLGLPALQRDFATATGVEWVVTSYLIAVAVSQLASGWIGDRFGRRRAFITALSIFTIASLMCAVAPGLWYLVGARVLQGAGGGLLTPTGLAMIYELFEPEERGRALGIFSIAVMAAPAVGPILGGTLVESIGWRWLFLINVPVGVVSVPVAIRLLRDTGYREDRAFDAGGLALAGSGLVALLIGLQQGGSWGWSSPSVVGLLVGGALLVTLFTVRALHHPAPVVDMRIFANPVFAISMIALSLMTMAQYCRLVYVPLELETTRGIGEQQIGLIMMPNAIGLALTMPIGGRLTDRIGAKVPFVVGSALLFAGFWPLAHISASTRLWTIALTLFIGGLGTGIAIMAPNVVSMNSVRGPQVGQASGLSQVTRQVAAAFGTATLVSVFVRRAPDVRNLDTPELVRSAISAYNLLFFIALTLIAAGAAVGLFMPGRSKALELQRARRSERDELIEAGAFVAEM